MSELSGQKVIIDFVDRPRQVHIAEPTDGGIRVLDGFLRVVTSEEQVFLFPTHTIREVKVLAVFSDDE